MLFADDTNIFITGETVEEAYENTNKALKEICDYMLANQHHCQYITYSRKVPESLTFYFAYQRYILQYQKKTSYLEHPCCGTA